MRNTKSPRPGKPPATPDRVAEPPDPPQNVDRIAKQKAAARERGRSNGR